MNRVLHVITSLELGGAQAMLLKVLSGLRQSNVRHEVLSLMDRGIMKERFADQGIPVHELRMDRSIRPMDIYSLVNKVRQVNPVILQGWMYHGNIAASVCRMFLPRSSLFWNIRHSVYRLDDEKKLTAWLIRLGAWISSMPDRILYNSHVAARQHEALGYEKEKTLVVPNCFDVDKFSPCVNSRLSVREELNLNPSTLLIGLFGRYHPVKDHPNFLRAAGGLSKAVKDVHFVLAGSGVDNCNSQLVELIEKNQLNGSVHLLGERRDMDRLLAGMDIVTSCSYGEGMSNVVGEAMACGVPCAVTDVGDNGILVGDTGRVIPPRDSEALENAWRKLIEIGSNGRLDLGNAARARVMQHFMADSVISQYEALYEKGLLVN